MKQVMQQVNLFIDELELRVRHGVDRLIGEISILHERRSTLNMGMIRSIVYALSQIVFVLMSSLERLPRSELRAILYEDTVLMPNSFELKIRNHVPLKREKCIFVRGMARFVFIDRDFHNHAHHVGIVGNPLTNLTLNDVHFMDHSTILEFLVCFCIFFQTIEDII